jgi:hypothetical protein
MPTCIPSRVPGWSGNSQGQVAALYVSRVYGRKTGLPYWYPVDAMRTVAAVRMGPDAAQITRSAMADSGNVSSGSSPSKGRLK